MAAFVADPEKLLWKPGERLISVPKQLPSLYSYGYRNGFRFEGLGNSLYCGIGDAKFIRKLEQDRQALYIYDLGFFKIPRDTPDGFHRYKQYGMV